MKTVFTFISKYGRVNLLIIFSLAYSVFYNNIYAIETLNNVFYKKQDLLQDKIPSNKLGKQLWSANHTDGTQNEWYVNGGGGEFNSESGNSVVSTDVAKTGKYSLKMSINTTNGSGHATRNYRWGEISKNEDLIFTQYFYFPNRIDFDRNNDWFNLIQTKGVKFAPGGAGTGPDQINLPHFVLGIEVRGGTGSGGANYLSLADLQKFWGGAPNVTWRAPAGVDLPVRKWVKIQMRIIQDRGDKGRVLVWQDDVLIIDTQFRNTLRPEVDTNMFSINAYADKTYPNITSIYVDDLSINLPADPEEEQVAANPPYVNISSPQNETKITYGEGIEIRAEAKADGDNTITKVDFYRGDNFLGSSSQAPFLYKWSNPGEGTHKLKAVARDNKGLMGTSEEVLLVVEPEKPPLANVPEADGSLGDPETRSGISLNLGSSSEVRWNSNIFTGESGQEYYKSTTYTYSESSASEEPLFQTERNAPDLRIEIPVQNGMYTVKTYHNELWFGKKGPPAIKGRRVFDIRIEGDLVKERLDLFTESNNKPVELAFENIEVNDGKLNINMQAWSNRATISGLSIIPHTPGAQDGAAGPGELFELYINTGTENKDTYDAKLFQGEIGTYEYFTSSSTHTYPKASNQRMFQSERHAPNLGYAITVPNGTYLIKTYHNELWFGHQGPKAQRGRRVFDIVIEGKTVKKNFDLFVESNNKEIELAFDEIVVKDGLLNLDMMASANRASISGIAIIQKSDMGGTNLKMAEGDSSGEPQGEAYGSGDAGGNVQVLLYPNPASDRVYLDLSGGYQSFLLHDSQGNLINHFYPDFLQKGEKGYILPLDGLKKGVYLISLLGAGQDVKRLRLLVHP
ncbi:malectin domain-containing carbohydrate-binding protein [Negadavirga shengliensis]|uniref:Malectin domain-containing carbohydrate-binding protein n=1 Tax=Negadavirga shengliensis TaxID=1389218 RepID=A0ABV9T916_9BACT